MSVSVRYQALHPYLDRAAYCSLVLSGFFIPLSITATDIFLLLAAIGSVLSGRVSSYLYALKSNPIVLTSLCILLLVLLGSFWSIAPWSDRMAAVHKYSKLLYIPLLMPLCLDRKWRERAIYAFLLAMIIVVIISYLKMAFSWEFGPWKGPGAVFYSHIETSYLVAFATYLLVYYAWQRPKWRVAALVLAAVFTYQEFFINDGRTGWVAYIVLLLLYFAQRVSWTGFVVGAMTVLLLIFSLYNISPVFKRTFDNSIKNVEQYRQGNIKTSLGYRLSFALLSWGLVKEHWILGSGTGSFKTAYIRSGGVSGWKDLSTPHNEYLLIAVQLGGIGLISLLSLFWWQWKLTSHLGEVKLFSQALMLSFIISCGYNSFLHLTVSGHFYVLFTALCYAGYRVKNA